MNNTTENFWQVFSNLEPWQPPVVIWRLYYDDAGMPLFYSQEDAPGNYIDITPEQYQRASMQVKVREGRLIELSTNRKKKMMPSSTGTPCYPTDVSIVVDSRTEHQCWRLKYND